MIHAVEAANQLVDGGLVGFNLAFKGGAVVVGERGGLEAFLGGDDLLNMIFNSLNGLTARTFCGHLDWQPLNELLVGWEVTAMEMTAARSENVVHEAAVQQPDDVEGRGRGVILVEFQAITACRDVDKEIAALVPDCLQTVTHVRNQNLLRTPTAYVLGAREAPPLVGEATAFSRHKSGLLTMKVVPCSWELAAHRCFVM